MYSARARLWSGLVGVAAVACAPPASSDRPTRVPFVAASTAPRSTERAEAATAPPVIGVPTAVQTGPLVNDSRFHSDLEHIARVYESMNRVDGSYLGPLGCGPGGPPPPSVSRAISGAHARKLYQLFVKDAAAYQALTGDTGKLIGGPVNPPSMVEFSQVVVKDAWKPKEGKFDAEECHETAFRNARVQRPSPAYQDGKTLYACQRSALFIMYKPLVPPPVSDDGWVYGTVELDWRATPPVRGEAWESPRVTAAGRVESCMGCHDAAPHGRLFGLQKR